MRELCVDKKEKKLPHIPKNSEKTTNNDMLKAYKVIQEKIKMQTFLKKELEKVFLEVTPRIDELNLLREQDKITQKHFDELLKIVKKVDKAKDFISKRKYMKYIQNVFMISVFYQELELAKISVAPSDTNKEKIDKLFEWANAHKYWLFSAAGGINADIETTKEASKPLINELKKRGIFPKED